MKKVTLFLVTLLLATLTSVAQQNVGHRLSPSHVAALLPEKKVNAEASPKKATLQHQVDMERLHARRALLARKKAEARQAAGKAEPAMKRAPKKVITGDEPFITEQPEGTQQIYSRQGSAYYVYWFYVLSSSYSGAVGNVVFGPNNEVYIKNIISQFSTNSWVKGTLNGNKITIEFPQKAMVYSGEDYYVKLLAYDAEERWYVDSDNQTLTLNYNATTGAITTPLGSDFSTGNVIVAMVDGEEDWTGYGDWNVTMSVMTDQPVTAPEGMETAQYAVLADGFDGTLANVGFAGDDVYVQGLYPGMPEAWVKGTIQGDKAVFKTGQYMGADELVGFHQYFVSATAEEVYDEDYDEWYTQYSLSTDDVTFDYDAATKTFSNGTTFLVNAGTSSVYYAQAYSHAKMSPFTEVAATPAAPEWNGIYEGGVNYYYGYEYGWGYLDFNVAPKDADGNFILSDKLSYQLFTKVNGEVKPLVLSAENYVNLDEDMEELPYGFTENYDIYLSGQERQIYYFIVGPEEYGVQTIYRGAGEERRSDIAWYAVSGLGAEVQPDAATPDYPDLDPSDVGSAIGYGFYTGNETVEAFGDALEQTYDVAIHVQDEALVGTHIESITIPVMATEDVSGLKVWLSSQLRVEDNQNEPDLVSIDVADAKAGFVTVKLEKPYIIPEGGVYAGYSLTIDDASKEVNEAPVAVVAGAQPGGLYLHSTKNMIKWLDMAEALDGCAAVQVTVSGSKVKENAAAPQDGEKTYVSVNKPIETDLVVVNHGSEGIKSLDIDYVLAEGLTGTQHIDLEEPVDGFFGKSVTVSLLLPSLSDRGNYELQTKVAKVNGVDNADAAPTSVTPFVVMNSVPKKRAVMEEYTGTWCQYCPRGAIALEKLAKLYGDDYVLLSYHNGDPMEIMESYYFPSSVSGYPDAWIDRAENVDPYYGSSNNDPFYVATDMAKRNKLFGHASVEFQSELSADGQAVNVSTEVIFPYDDNEAKYALEYVLVADGLTGEGSDWDQVNAYAGGNDGEDFEFFNNAGSPVSGLTFNDVVVLSPHAGSGAEESIPEQVKADEPIAHKYSFLLADAVNTDGEEILQEQATLKVAVLLLNTETGEIVNANIAPVGGATGIQLPDAGREVDGVASVKYYDLGGRQLTTPQRGINIVSVTYADGTVQTLKMKR